MSDHNLPEGFRPDDPTAHDKAHTDHADVVFALKESADGTPWIMLEPRGPGLPVLKAGDAHLGLTFREGVSFKEAESLTAEMQSRLQGVSYMKFIT